MICHKELENGIGENPDTIFFSSSLNIASIRILFSILFPMI